MKGMETEEAASFICCRGKGRGKRWEREEGNFLGGERKEGGKEKEGREVY